MKVGLRGNTIYLESHPDLYNKDPMREQIAVERLREAGLLEYVDAIAMHRAITEERGNPVPIGVIPPIDALPAQLPQTTSAP